MKDGTLNIIKSILDNDETLSNEYKSAILAYCKKPTAIVAPATPDRVHQIQYLTTKEVAVKLGVTTRQIQRWISTGKLSSLKFGASRRIPADALEDLSALDPSSRGLHLTSGLNLLSGSSRKAS
jgi:excisionase family DNA binding protein